MLKLNFSLSEGSRTHNHRIITENLPLLILQIVATSRVINLLFSQKYQALQITQSDPTAVLRHFLLISKTWLSLKNIAGDTVPEFYSIWIPFSQELLHASKNWPEWQQQVWGQSLSHRTSMHAGEKKKQQQIKPTKPEWRAVSWTCMFRNFWNWFCQLHWLWCASLG